MQTIRQKVIAVLVLFITALGGGYTVSNFGGVTVGNEYLYKTSTSAGHTLVKTGPTSLGSVLILTPTAQTFTIWNATSTKDVASTSVGQLEASAVEGTYTFDIQLDRGLVVEPAPSFAGQYVTTYR